jgi:hypothetical protein
VSLFALSDPLSFRSFECARQHDAYEPRLDGLKIPQYSVSIFQIKQTWNPKKTRRQGNGWNLRSHKQDWQRMIILAIGIFNIGMVWNGTQLYNTSLNLSGLSLITGLYMLEPWERKMFNIFLIGLLTVSCTTIYTIKHIFFWITFKCLYNKITLTKNRISFRNLLF